MHTETSEAVEIQASKERQAYYRAVTKWGPAGIPVPLSLRSEFNLAHEPVDSEIFGELIKNQVPSRAGRSTRRHARGSADQGRGNPIQEATVPPPESAPTPTDMLIAPAIDPVDAYDSNLVAEPETPASFTLLGPAPVESTAPPPMASLIDLAGGWDLFKKAAKAAITHSKSVQSMSMLTGSKGCSAEQNPVDGSTFAAELVDPEPDKVTFERMGPTPEAEADKEHGVIDVNPEPSSVSQCFLGSSSVTTLAALETPDGLRLEGEAAALYQLIPYTSGRNELKRDMRTKEGKAFKAFLAQNTDRRPTGVNHPTHRVLGNTAKAMDKPSQETAAWLPLPEAAPEATLLTPTMDQVEACVQDPMTAPVQIAELPIRDTVDTELTSLEPKREPLEALGDSQSDYPISRYIRTVLEPVYALAKAEGRSHDARLAQKTLKVAQEIENTHWLIVSDPDQATLDDWLEVRDYCLEAGIDPALPPRPAEPEDGPGHWAPDEPWMRMDDDGEVAHE